MEVRITFRSEVYIEGDNLRDIKEKWESLPLYSQDAEKADADFIELISVEDADTHKNLKYYWNKL